MKILYDGGFMLHYAMNQIRGPFNESHFIEYMYNIIDKFTSLTKEHIICLDRGSWRKKVDENYKANRKERKAKFDKELVYAAYDKFIEKFESAGGQSFGFAYTEADDIITYITQNYDDTFLIVSSDKDLTQLLSSNVYQYDMVQKVLYISEDMSNLSTLEMVSNTKYSMLMNVKTRLKIEKEVVISPNTLLLEKFIMGDKSDNIKSIVQEKKGSKTYRFPPKLLTKVLADVNTQYPNLNKDSFKSKEVVDGIFSICKSYKSNSDLTSFYNNIRMVLLDNACFPKNIKKSLKTINLQNSLLKGFDKDYLFSLNDLIVEEEESFDMDDWVDYM